MGGLILSYFDSRFFILAAAGFFGPGILAEFGLVQVEEFRREFPHAAFHDVVGAGHMVAGDRNDAFSAAVVDFIAGVPQPESDSIPSPAQEN